MTTTKHPTWTFRRTLAELPFIPATSNWLKLLFSLLAEPLMFVASLCIIAETVLPGASTWPGILTNGPTVVMSLAPEIVLPGCFQQAQQALRRGNLLKGNLLLCLCALFGMLTLVTLASFLWHFSGVIDNLILFIRCGSGISYTIILNISGQDEEQARDASSGEHDDQMEHLTQTVNALTAQLTTVLSITQNNQFLVSPLQEALQVSPMRETPLLEGPPCLSPAIQPLRLHIRNGQADLRLLTLVAHQTQGEFGNDRRKTGMENHGRVQEDEPSPIVYPVVTGVSAEKVRQLIDASVRGTKWRDMPGNYSQTIKPVREAWERMQATMP